MNRSTDYAHASLAAGSRSFAAAARLLPSALRDDVARLYAWCRLADDVIDGQTTGHGARAVAEPAACLAGLAAATEAALAGRRTGHEVFDGFGEVAARHAISPALARDVLDGFAMDVEGRAYATPDALATYCYGVAGAVGVMMALVLGVAAQDRDTLDRACDLGLAFQMTNIARDVVADAAAGRVYLPAEWLAAEGVAPTPAAVGAPENAPAVHRAAVRLVAAAEPYYASAAVGIARLPFRSAWAIAAARAVYRDIGARRRAAGPDGLAVRVGTSAAAKLRLLVMAVAVAARPASRAPVGAREGLWTRPPRP